MQAAGLKNGEAEAEEESYNHRHCAGLNALCDCGAWHNRFCGGAMKKLFILQNN